MSTQQIQEHEKVESNPQVTEGGPDAAAGSARSWRAGSFMPTGERLNNAWKRVESKLPTGERVSRAGGRVASSFKATGESMSITLKSTSESMSNTLKSTSESMSKTLKSTSESVTKTYKSIEMPDGSRVSNALSSLTDKPSSEPQTAPETYDVPTKDSWTFKGAPAAASTQKKAEESGFQFKGFKGKYTKIEKGSTVKTPYGSGVVDDWREADGMYVVQLDGSSRSTLYCRQESLTLEKNAKKKPDGKRSMQLNEAYQALEKMRRLNLEVECMEHGVACADIYEKCPACLFEKNDNQSARMTSTLWNMVDERRKHQKQHQNCLICATPACNRHSCPNFRKQSITLCLDCVQFFDLKFIMDCVSPDVDDEYRNKQVQRMVDLYDRAVLLLKYSSQFIEPIAQALEEKTKSSNRVNVGSSSVGLVSGALGVAAAAAILTPAGPPLLVASLFFGGSATAVQTGTEAMNYFSEPNKLADRILALNGMVHSLLRVSDSLRQALTSQLEKIHEQHQKEIEAQKRLSLAEAQKVIDENDTAIRAGTTVARNALLVGAASAEVGTVAAAATGGTVSVVAGAEMGTLAGRNANFFSKTGTAVARGARFARFAGGALSAATLVLEAKTMQSTLQKIQAGDPCEKADQLRKILKEMDDLPKTETLDDECQIYLKAMSSRFNAESLEKAMQLIEEKAIREYQAEKEEKANQGIAILDGEDDLQLEPSFEDEYVVEDRMTQSMQEQPVTDTSEPSGERMSRSMTQESSSSSLLQRIQMFKSHKGESSMES